MTEVALLHLLVACGSPEVTIDREVSPAVGIEAAGPLVPEEVSDVAAQLVGVVASYGYPTAHMEHANFLVDDKAVNRLEDKEGISRGGALAFAMCLDYREFCAAVFRQSTLEDVSARQVVFHETLHLLGFRHERCEIDHCEGIMGPVINRAFDQIAPEDITREYLHKLLWVRPVQPGDEQ
jgi:hypothetical protein